MGFDVLLVLQQTAIASEHMPMKELRVITPNCLRSIKVAGSCP